MLGSAVDLFFSLWGDLGSLKNQVTQKQWLRSIPRSLENLVYGV